MNVTKNVFCRMFFAYLIHPISNYVLVKDGWLSYMSGYVGTNLCLDGVDIVGSQKVTVKVLLKYGPKLTQVLGCVNEHTCSQLLSRTESPVPLLCSRDEVDGQGVHLP